jgi:hypothetical protein
MRKFRYGLVAAAALAAAAFASPLQAQPYGPGYGMMGGYGPGYMMHGYGMGPGMMGGYGPGWGRGMMGGYGPGYMMRGWGGGYGMGPGMMRGYGYGMGPGMGPGMMGYGPGYYGNQGNLNLTTDQVKQYLEQMIRNPNLTVGDVKEKDADTIVAEIVTKQGHSLVQRLDFNRHNGFVQPEQ